MKQVDQKDLPAAIDSVAGRQGRKIIAVAGPPGAGKSTLAEWLAEELGSKAAVVPMDGFHLSNDVLKARGLFERKGAPETFDSQGFASLLRTIRAGGDVSYPTFDRTADAVVPDSAVLPGAVEIVIVEGNYLLLDDADWRPLEGLWDASIWLDVPLEELERRLVDRWLHYGLAPEAARQRALSNDIPNARRTVSESRPADFVVVQAG